MQLIYAFKSLEYKIVFASTAAQSDHAVDLNQCGITVKTIKINDASFDEFINGLKPDIVMFDRFMTEEQFGWRVAEQCPNALRLLDTQDLHSLRKTREACFKAKEKFAVEAWLKADITKREIASIYRCDLSLIISQYEMKLLQNTLEIDRALLHYVPFMLDEITPEVIKRFPSFTLRNHFLTIGNFRHNPNYDAVIYLKDIIWPIIKKQLPKAQMHIYGAYPMQKVTQLHNEKDGFLIKGWTKNAKAVMQKARVCLAPLRFGAGLKGKFIEAMQNGTPCITTSFGAEGLSENFGGFIEEDPGRIAKKAIELYTNETLWLEKQQRGFSLINEKFNKTPLEKTFLQRIETTSKQLHRIRLNNFTGAMLQYQSMQSTKYMSRWIEAKNQKE